MEIREECFAQLKILGDARAVVTVVVAIPDRGVIRKNDTRAHN